MKKAIAMALTQDNAFTLAAISISNFIKLIGDFMYGTPERAKYTYTFVIVLSILSAAMQLTNANTFSACSHDALPTGI
jgi:hypothetical protein